MEAIERRETELKKELDECDTFSDRRRIRNELREIRRKAQELESQTDINANDTTFKNLVNDTKTADSKMQYKITADEDDGIREKSAEERSARRAKRQERMKLNKEDDKKEDTTTTTTTTTLNKENDKKEVQTKTSTAFTSSSSRLRETVTEKNDSSETKEATSSSQSRETKTFGSRSSFNSPNTMQNSTSKYGKSYDLGKKFGEQKAPIKPMDTGLSFAKKDTGLSFAKKDTGLSYGKKVDPAPTVKKEPLTKVEPVKKSEPAKKVEGQQYQNFGLDYSKKSTVKKTEFGSSFTKKESISSKFESKSSFKGTSPGTNFKKDTPVSQPQQQTAPATSAFSMKKVAGGSSGGSAAAAVADRMKLFREAAEKEKAAAAKRIEKERLEVAENEASVKKRTAPCMKKKDGEKKPLQRRMSISQIVLDWCKEMCREYGIEIRNFSASWNNGMAFCALIHKFNPDSFDFKALDPVNRAYNFKLAFETAQKVKNIPMLLDVEDMVRMPKPEPRSVQCYVQWIWSVYGPISGYGPTMEEIRNSEVA